MFHISPSPSSGIEEDSIAFTGVIIYLLNYKCNGIICISIGDSFSKALNRLGQKS
jgi:hypothetical protein